MAPYAPPDASEASARRQTWAALGVILAALVVGALPTPMQDGLAAALRASVLRPFVAMQEALVQGRLRSVEVERLRARLDSAYAALTAQSTLNEENQRLRGLLGLSDRLAPGYRPATVVRPGTADSESMFLLDVGLEAGVTARAPVVTREGLAGVVRQIRRRSAVGMDWTHPDFRASAMTLDGLTFGIVEPERSDFREADRLLLSGTPFSTDLEPGTVVVTSGLGGVFPRGIPIGRVRELAEAVGGWRKSYRLDPFVDPGSLTHVLVLDAVRDTTAGLGSAWSPDDLGGRAERLARDSARADSLAALTVEVERLRARLDSLLRPPPPAGEGEGG